jgi:HK97 family phage prohead protease
MNFDFEAAKGKQVRTVHAELRDSGSDDFALVGYASVFNTLSHNLGGFRETIKPGTYSRSIREKADVKALFNHAPDNILGRTKSGTLTLSEDARGLKFRCQLDKNSQAHRDLYSAVKRGDIDECSFAFTVPAGGQQWAPGKDPETGEDCAIRTISDVDLIDVSVVTYPAYPNTAAGARNQRSKPDYGVPVDVDQLIVQLRKLALAGALCSDLVTRKSPYPKPYDYASLSKHSMRAMELCSAAFACSDMIDDSLDDWDDDDSDNDDRAHAAFHRALRAAQKASHSAVDSACDQLARTHAAMARCIEAGKK